MPKARKVRKTLSNVSNRHMRRIVQQEASIIQSSWVENLQLNDVERALLRQEEVNENDHTDSSCTWDDHLSGTSSSTLKNAEENEVKSKSNEASPNQTDDELIVDASFGSDDSNPNSSIYESDIENSALNDFDNDSDNDSVLNQDQQIEDVPSFKSLLTEWGLTENISHLSMYKLLEVLKTHNCHAELPKDPRTLFKTPRNTDILDVAPGSYWHYGLAGNLQNFIEQTKLDSSNPIELAIGIDGLPLSESSTSALWPILGSVIPHNFVFLIGAYHGYSKPDNADTFLRSFVTEAVDLIENGLHFNDKSYKIVIKQIICDAPAKSFILNVKGHTGYSSCTKCTVEGEYRKNRVCFADINAPKRTDDDFRSHIDEDYHLGSTILEEIPELKIPDNVPTDPMHLTYHGVTKKILVSLKSGELRVRLADAQVEMISERLESEIKPCIPLEFARKPRALKHLKHWKATEFRQFLLYTGPIAFRNIISNDLYTNFLTLHVAVRILSCPLYSKKLLNYAQELLNHFVISFNILYGEHQVSHNIHGLIHLPDDVSKFGPLDTFSAFKFENFMRVLKSLLRKSEEPLQQLSRRYSEKLNCSINKDFRLSFNCPAQELCSLHYDGPLVEDCTNPQYKEIRFPGYTFRVNDGANDCCGLENGKIVRIKNIAFCNTRHQVVIIGKEYRKREELFTSPCLSSLIDIHVVGKLSALKVFPVTDICMKFVALPFLENKYAVFPMIHM